MRRIALALASFFAILSRPEFAAQVELLREGGNKAPQPQATPAPAPAVPVPREAPVDAALQLLGLLQRDARFIDFVEEDIAGYEDAEIGAAGRLVHEGCRKVLREHFSLQPLRPENEGSRITLKEGFDAAEVRLAGKVVGQPPFSGSITHRGWRVVETRLPKLTGSHDPAIVAQAEVEL